MSFGFIALGLGVGGGAAAAIGATTVGAVINSRSQKKAAETQAQATRESNRLIADQFAQTKATLQPFIEGGREAFQLQQAQSGALGPEAQQNAFANFNDSPGVAFARERGLRAINRDAAAPGGNALIGGNTDKARISFAQGLAQQDFGNQFNRLGAITGTSLGAAQAVGGVGAQAAQGQAQGTLAGGNAVASGILGTGQAQAQGRIGQANAFGSAIGDLGAIFGNSKLFGNSGGASTAGTVGRNAQFQGNRSPSSILFGGR